MLVKFGSCRPLLLWKQKFQNVNSKFAINSAHGEDTSQILAQSRYFGVIKFVCVSEICLKPTPISMVTKIWKFEYKITISRCAYDAVCYTHDRKTANVNVNN